jgi:hypothetical protein
MQVVHCPQEWRGKLMMTFLQPICQTNQSYNESVTILDGETKQVTKHSPMEKSHGKLMNR